jgi:hypothetical protein
MAGRVRVVGYVDVDELQADPLGGDGRVSAAAFDEIRTLSVDDLDDLETEVEE